MFSADGQNMFTTKLGHVSDTIYDYDNQCWHAMYIFIRSALIWLLPKALGTSHPEQHVLRAAAGQLCHLEPFGQWQIPGTCPTDGGLMPARNETTASPGEGDGDGDGWIRGSICHEIPGGSDAEFCTFTHLSFNDGLGVSIVTTPEVFERVSALPVFAAPHGGRKTPPAPGPAPGPASAYRDVPIPGKGVGLVAARRLAAGETFLSRTPAVMVDDAAFRRLGRARLAELLARAADDLPAAHRAGYLALATHDEVRTPAERAYQVFMKNNFRTPIQDVEVFHSTFTQGERASEGVFFFFGSPCIQTHTNIYIYINMHCWIR